jgi:hypothetical protein
MLNSQTVSDFFRQQAIGLRKDFIVWCIRSRRTWVGLTDLCLGRVTVKRNAAQAKLRMAAAWIGLCLFLYALGRLIPEGYDWNCCFKTLNLPPFFVPWTLPLLPLLNPSLLFALTVFGVVVRMRRYHSSVWRIGLALISLPTLWVLFLGNIDGLVLIGLWLLPIGVPLVLIKPQIASFALLANRRSILATIIWIAISFLIWGIWPLRFIGVGGPQWYADWPQDIALFPWGIVIALPLLWLSRGDEDMLMAAGSFGTPHLFPYHFILLMPALARMGRGWAILSWLLAWTPLLANYFGPMAWHLGNLTSVSIWLGLYLARRSATQRSSGQLEILSNA